MGIRKLVLYPSEPLQAVAKPYESVGPEVAALVEDMFDTMYAYEGLGLAAPQIGVSRRMFVLGDPEGNEMCLVNPVIVESEGEEEGEEGCLSLPRVYTNVVRASRVRVQALDERGKQLDFRAEGLLARIIQHELDHLNGLIFLDRVDVLTRQAKLHEWEGIREQMTAPANQG